MAIAGGAAIVYTVLYLFLGLYRIDRWQSFLLIALWIVVAIALFAFFRQRSLVREEMIRRYYISDSWIYNHEIGYAPLNQIVTGGNAYDFVTFAAESLAEMSYGFDVADAPDDFDPKFLVTSQRFGFHRSGGGVVIDQWKGKLLRIDGGADDGAELGSFANAGELAMLLDEHGVLP